MATTITTLTGLQAMKDTLDGDFVLGANIDASPTSGWDSVGFEPVGTSATPFTGTFVGTGYTISDLFINRPTTDYVGLFGVTDGVTITDCVLTGVDITGDDYVGGCVGYAVDCTITGSSTTGDVKGVDDSVSQHIGGFAGTIYTSTATTCYSTADVNGGNQGAEVGGFVGEDLSGNTFTSCYSTGTVAGAGVIGGFAGQLYGGSTFTKCYATGAVSGTDDYVGGFGGGTSFADGTTISKCYAIGNVTSTGSFGAGGFVGDISHVHTISNCYARGSVTASSTDTVGGFIGYNDEGTLTNCYSMGAVSGDTNVGGFVGDNNTGTLTDCFWDTQTSGQASSDGGTGKTTVQMKLTGTYTNWDFTTIWNRNAALNDGYPYLRWSPVCDADSETREETIGPIYDPKGRVPKGARVEARRADTGAVVETEYLDSSGKATFTELPNDTDVTFWTTWGGSTQNTQTIQSAIVPITRGGTGASDEYNARTNLGIIRPAHYIVAANDATGIFKAQADYVCDATDDHVQIQAAIDALPATGGKVLLTEGTFNAEVTITLDSYQTLQGMGRNTILTTTTADLDIITATGGSGTEKTGILIADLCIDGTAGGGVNDIGVLWTFVDDSIIKNCWILNHGEEGIQLTTCDNNEIIANTFNDTTWDGVYLKGSTFNLVSNNTFNGNDVGIYLGTAANNNSITVNTSTGGGSTGIYIIDSSHNSITGNICEGHATYGIYFDGADGNAILGNVVYNNSTGIQVDDSDDCVITGNSLRSNGGDACFITNSSLRTTVAGNILQGNQYGIEIDGSHESIITGNMCSGSTEEFGIAINNANFCTVTGNTLNDNSWDGILVYGVSNTVSGNTCQGNGRYGIKLDSCRHCAIIGNNCTENSQTTDNTYDDIIAIAADYNNIQGNVCRAGGETNKPRYGINISNATCDGNKVINNDLYDDGFGTGAFNDDGTSTIYVEPGIDDTPVDSELAQPISSNWAYDHQTITNAPTGFPNRTDSTLSFATITFTIAPSNGSFDYYIAGIKYTKSSADNIAIDDTTSGTHIIYYDGSTLSESVNPNDATMHDLIENKALVGIVYWNATDDVAYLLADERHGGEMSGATHIWLHETNGAAYHNGLTLSGYTEDTDSDAALTFELTDGGYEDEDLEHVIIDGSPATQYSQQLNGGDAEIPIIYKDDVDGSWTEDAATTLPYKSLGASRLAYNKDDGDETFSQVEVGDGNWVSMTLIATNDWQYPIKAIQGQNEYTDKKTAVEEATNELISFGGGSLSPEVITLYRLVLRTKDTFGGTKKTLIEVDGVTDFRTSSIIGGGAVATDHGSLGGLGDDDHAQYIKDTEFTQDSGFLVGTGAGTFAEETGATLRTSIGVGTGDSPEVTAVNVGHASDTTVARSAAGRLTVESVNLVRGPSSSTDNAIVRFNATTGDLIQDYTSNPPTISDSGDITVDGDVTADNIITAGNVDGVDVSAHASRHDSGGADQVHSIADDDDDTKIQVEESADEDIIRMDVGGTEAFNLDADGIFTLAKQSRARAYLNTAQSMPTIATTTWIPVAFDTELFDEQDEGDYTVTTGTATAGTAGTTLIDSGASFVGGDVGKWAWNTKAADPNLGEYTTIASVDSGTQVTLTADIGIDVDDTYMYGFSRFTASVAGYYSFSVLGSLVNLGDGKKILVGGFKNGSLVLIARTTVGGTDYVGQSGSTTIYLAATDYVDMRMSHNHGSNIDAAAAEYYNHISVHKIS